MIFKTRTESRVATVKISVENNLLRSTACASQLSNNEQKTMQALRKPYSDDCSK